MATQSNAKGTRESVRNVLDFPKQVKVDLWVREKYQAVGKNDKESAEIASADLNFPVSAGNIKYFREIHQIPSNFGRRVVSDDYAKLETLVMSLESNCNDYHRRISELEETVRVLKLAAKHNKS